MLIATQRRFEPGLILATALALAAPVWAVPTCVTISDDFADGVFDTRFGRDTAGGCATVAEGGGVITISQPVGCGWAGVFMDVNQAVICGDFDIRVDVNLNDFGTPPSGHARAAGVAVRRASDNALIGQLECFRKNFFNSCIPADSTYKFWTSSPDDCAAIHVQRTTSNARLRVTREGNVLRMFYWDAGASIWLLARQETASTADAKIDLFSGRSIFSVTQSVTFDNLSIQALLPDQDGDGVADDVDNAPYVPNASQADGDGDGTPDVLDYPAVNVAQLLFNIVPLQPVPNAIVFDIDPVSAAGYVVGRGDTSAGGAPVRWNASGAATLLASPGSFPEPFGVNAAGAAVGRAQNPSVTPFLWNPDTSATVLGPVLVTARAASDTGWIVGQHTLSYPVRWTPGGWLHRLRTFGGVGGDTESTYDVNDFGQSVGQTRIGYAGLGVRPILWQPDGRYRELPRSPSVPAGVGYTGIARGINNRADACGTINIEGTSPLLPVRWLPDGTPIDLPVPPGTNMATGGMSAIGIDNYGNIVGRASINGQLNSVIWGANNIPYLIADLLEGGPTNIRIEQVYGIDSNAQHIRIAAQVRNTTTNTLFAALLTAVVPPADSDYDGSADDADNCADLYNPNQDDVNLDDEGDTCDPGMYEFDDVVSVEYDAASNLTPDAAAPPWTLVDSASPEDPIVADGNLTISTSGDSENMYYTLAPPALMVEFPLVIEARMRFGSGQSSSYLRGPATVFFATAPDTGGHLWIGRDEVFTQSIVTETRQQTACVDTDDAFHTYRIVIDASGAYRVLYDGTPILGGVVSVGTIFPDNELVGWGEGTTAAYGVSEWKYVRIATGDRDRDADGVFNGDDNCPDVPNPDQEDFDGNGVGDACETCVQGDANCDGVTDFFDIDPFLQSLFDPTGYAAAFCGGSACAVDIDCNGVVDFFDIDPFVQCLFSSCPPCP